MSAPRARNAFGADAGWTKGQIMARTNHDAAASRFERMPDGDATTPEIADMVAAILDITPESARTRIRRFERSGRIAARDYRVLNGNGRPFKAWPRKETIAELISPVDAIGRNRNARAAWPGRAVET